MFAADGGSERATSIEDYQNTCAEFVSSISSDYKDWVDRYQLGEDESRQRKSQIDYVVKRTNDWIYTYCNTIKKVDIVMNDGVNKMAENTAGYPFKLDVIVNGASRYTENKIGRIRLRVCATPREGKKARIGHYHKNQLFLINSSCEAKYEVSQESLSGADILNDYIIIDARNGLKNDLISVTVVVEEVLEDYVAESRGYSTIVRLV